MDGVQPIEFSWELWKNAITEDVNAVLSPISILSAFSMLLSGAKGHTAKKLKKALNIDPDVGDDKYHHAFTGYMQTFNKLAHGSEEEVRVSLSNRLFLQPDYNLESQFVDVLHECYLSEVGVLNFSNGLPAVITINKWMEQQTDERLANIVDTRLVLVNAIHFKGNWEWKFSLLDTQGMRFHMLHGPPKKVAMMKKENDMRVLDETFGKLQSQAVELRFVGGRFSLVVLVPKRGHLLHNVEDSLSANEIHRVMHDMQMKWVHLNLPRFRVESQMDMDEAFSRLGTSNVFSNNWADLSGICIHEKLCVSQAVHKAFLSVDELGAEGAETKTAMELRYYCSLPTTHHPDVYVTVDRPFITWIWDQETCTVLFMARVTD